VLYDSIDISLVVMNGKGYRGGGKVEKQSYVPDSYEALAVFKPDEAASLLAERFNVIGWIYK